MIERKITWISVAALVVATAMLPVGTAEAQTAAVRPASAAGARPRAGTRPAGAGARPAGASARGRGRRPATAPTTGTAAQGTGQAGQAAAQPAPPDDPTVTQARLAYNEGRRLFDAGQFEQALENFRRAFELRSNPIVLLPIADCQERLGRVPGAIESLERYLRERTDAPDRAQVETRLSGLRTRPATLHVASTPPGGRILLDGAATPHTTPADIQTPPGRHTIRVELDGHDAFTQEAEPGPGARIEIAARLTATASSSTAVATTSGSSTPSTTDRTARPRGVNPAVWVAAGLAGATVIAGSVFGFMALSDRAEYDQRPTRDTLDRGERNALLADVFFGTAILSGAVALIVHLSTGGSAAASSSSSASIGPQRRVAPRLGVAPNGFVLNF